MMVVRIVKSGKVRESVSWRMSDPVWDWNRAQSFMPIGYGSIHIGAIGREVYITCYV